MELIEKQNKLKKILKELKSAVVAFSGGVDSTFLLITACEALKDNVIAVVCRSASFPEREFEKTIEIPKKYGIKYAVIETDELKDEKYRSNPPDRCYHCKKEILSKLIGFAEKNGYAHVIEGSNTDDMKDYRPGKRALEEMNIRSPLMEAGFSKQEIRALSKEMNLPTWDKPSMPCLSSRFPYGTEITEEKLKKVDKAEEFLSGLGLKQARVRYHGDIARIEVPKKDMAFILSDNISAKITEKFKLLGFDFTALDLLGYRMGSLNEAIKEG